MRNLVLALTVLFLFTGAVRAEFVDFGGDIQVRGFYRDKFELVPGAGSESWFDTQMRFFVHGRPLPDTHAYVRFIGERDWGREDIHGASSTRADIDLAYIRFDEIFGSPAAVKLGRQELLYGEGFLVGRNRAYSRSSYERSVKKSFDAARLVLDYTPFTLDFFGAVIEEGYGQEGAHLYGANLNYDYLRTAAVDLGIFFKNEEITDSRTIAFSARGEADVISLPGLSVKAEVVPQIGRHTDGSDLSALGGYAGFKYLLAEKKPSIVPGYFSANYYYMTGDDGAPGDFSGFDPMFNDMFLGEINSVKPNLGLATNAKILNLGIGWELSPVTSLGFEYYRFGRNEAVAGSTDFGSEINMRYVYRYTASSEFVLRAAYFMPDDILGTEDAAQVIAAVKMSF